MATLVLNHLRSFLENNNKCCSNCIVTGDKESLQCIDLDPPQIVTEIKRLNDKNIKIGLDFSQKEHEEELAKDAARKVFGKDLATMEDFRMNENETNYEDVTNENLSETPILEIKKEVSRTIKFEDNS